MYPHERSLVKKLAGAPFALIGVNSDSDLEKLKPVLKEENITWRSFWNGPEGTSGPISKRWSVDGWPTVYVIDAEGKIRYINPQRAEDGEQKLDEAIQTLLAEAGHEVDLSGHAEDGAKADGETDEAEGEEAKEGESEEKAGEDAE